MPKLMPIRRTRDAVDANPETVGVEELPTETWNEMARSPEPRAVALKGKHERGKREPARTLHGACVVEVPHSE